MKTLNQVESEKLLKNQNLCRNILTKNFNETSKWNSFPCVLKIMSDKFLHKTEINGVKIIYSKFEFEKSYNDLSKIIKLKKIKNAKILVQEFVDGDELIIGLKNDPTFGHVVLLGSGGILTELIQDISIRKCPVDKEEVLRMIDELKFKKILYGYRNKKNANIDSIIDAVVKISNLPKKYPKINELDINPFIVNSKEGKVCDARIVMG